jgi:succinate dehydrogenase / fumarate reductase cytochrome b subunit
VKTVAYYKGCLASLSAKELDVSTQALAPKLGLELEELESVTCCGAGDIHEAEPDYYLHLNARILAYAEQTGSDTLMTICNVCTLNLRQANWQLRNDEALRERVNANLETVGAPRYEAGVEVKHLLWLISEGEGYELPDPAALEDPRLRGSGPALVARADHRSVRRGGGRLSGQAEVLRLPDHPGA